jgi:cation:H+ antiporter
MNVPEIVIGLTIVAAGTSAPELFVSVVSALKGTPDLAVGNVVGSNTMNAMLIVGCAAMVAPMTISPSTVRKDIPFSVMASILMLVVCMDMWQSFSISGNVISRLDGIILLMGFAAFMYYTLIMARKGGVDVPEAEVRQASVWLSLLFVILGLGCLVVGSNLFVSSASTVATELGVSEGVIGLTIVAGGTSLPELATSVVAARKGQSAIAIGNVIGSNVFNILLILGLTAVISPMQIQGITTIDMGVMLLSVTLVWLFSYTKYTVARWEGMVLVGGYLVYLGWLLHNI